MAAQEKGLILEIWIMTLLYGIYVVIFSASVYTLLSRKHRSTTHKHLLSITIALFTICTTQDIITFLKGFLTTDVLANVYYPGEGEAVLRQKDIFNLIPCIANVLSTTNNLIADGLLIWRCFMVWGRRPSVILIPILMLIAGTICGYVVVAIQTKTYLLRLRAPLSETTPPPELFRLEHLNDNLTTAVFATSFVTNTLMSLLISGRIWWTTREVRQYFGKSHSKHFYWIASLIIESGSIYSLSLLLVAIFVPYGENFPGRLPFEGGVVQSISSQIVGIFPTLIIVLVALSKTSDQTLADMSLNPIEFAPPRAAGAVSTNGPNIDLRVTETSRGDREVDIAASDDN